ncbi:3-hydroxyacyl-CoA dehydrogenase family protein [Planctomicrobium sp. SH527]|uniref:3-hydroxyacyl-CoA dehydrogenase family protein n=1 Tax=Planctomicrobium sp. SH527 TaxID=3448123 RepID=UPI003F5B3438
MSHTQTSDPDMNPASPAKVVGVAGLGLLGRGIATCLLAHGFQVIAYDVQETTHAQARKHIAEALGQLVERGHFPKEVLTSWESRYRLAASLSEFSACDFVIESVIENLDVKESVFDQLEAAIGPTVPLASNTSALPISVLQERRKHPERMIGMHFGEPCHLTNFLEVIRGNQTDDATTEATIQLGNMIGKDPSLVQKDVPGFIVNRLGYALYREAFWMLEQGVADVATIDRAFSNAISIWANIAGPFRWMDLTGIPAYAAVMERLFPDLSQATEVPVRMKELVESGAQGIANGRGFYNYTPEEAAHWECLWKENVWRVNELRRDLEVS